VAGQLGGRTLAKPLCPDQYLGVHAGRQDEVTYLMGTESGHGAAWCELAGPRNAIVTLASRTTTATRCAAHLGSRPHRSLVKRRRGA
jgi:hypothetical protein